MNVYEMEGFLRGKFLPGDILVNESTAEYLVRKLNEATAVKAERDSLADKCGRLDYNLGNALVGEQETIRRADALAVENAALKDAIPRLKNIDYSNDSMDDVSLAEDIGFNTAVTQINNMVIETPATDAALAAIEARGVVKFAESQKAYVRKHRDELDPMTRAAYFGSAVDAEQYAKQLREAK
ncbi:MAG: hypothetical protein E7G96_02470 [Serratia liquefaciens]|nr:hypothetical protein [Serratia liquefaciens]